jgi:hypothetical protein
MQALGIFISSTKLLSIPNNGTDISVMTHPRINTKVKAKPVFTNVLK